MTKELNKQKLKTIVHLIDLILMSISLFLIYNILPILNGVTNDVIFALLFSSVSLFIAISCDLTILKDESTATSDMISFFEDFL